MNKLEQKLERLIKLLFATCAVVIVDRVGNEAEKKANFEFMVKEFMSYMREGVLETGVEDPDFPVLKQQLRELEDRLKEFDV